MPDRDTNIPNSTFLWSSGPRKLGKAPFRDCTNARRPRKPVRRRRRKGRGPGEKGLGGGKSSCRRDSIPSIPGPSPPEKVTRREEPRLPKEKKEEERKKKRKKTPQGLF